jgi:hypothetical protein
MGAVNGRRRVLRKEVVPKKLLRRSMMPRRSSPAPLASGHLPRGLARRHDHRDTY